MKAKLEFDLPEEQDDFEVASNGWKYRSVLFDLDNFLRNKLKYEKLTEEQYKAYSEVRELFWDTLRDDNLTLH
jgi:hypothetical protein